jgi:flagellar basal-body rod protein FlgG
MRFVRAVGPILGLLLIADVVIAADETGRTAKKEVASSATPPTVTKPAAGLPPHRDDSSTANRSPGLPSVAETTNPEWVVREALNATAQARQIVIGNLANVNTPGYKRQIVSFAAVLQGATPTAAQLREMIALDSAPRLSAVVATPHTDLRPGNLRRTERPLDLAIDGEGYFAVLPADDERAPDIYCTRCGRFELDNKRRIVLRGLKRDWLFSPSATVPDDTTKIEITPTGVINTTDGEALVNIGTMQLHSYSADWTFTPCGDSVFLVRHQARHSVCIIGTPGTEGRGRLKQGFLEESNVDPQQELEDLQRIQRQADALEQAARLLHPGAAPQGGPSDPLAK